ncbi:MAG: trans-sialidase, partial [Nitrosopumilaceae archaeon]
TAPSNKYFATRQRLAHHPFHPENKNFLGYGISLGHGTAQTQTQSAPPPPQQTQEKLPKVTAASSGGTGKSRKQELEDYEKDYLARLDIQEAEAVAEVEQTQTSSSQKHGSLPKGFTPQSAPPPPKP